MRATCMGRSNQSGDPASSGRARTSTDAAAENPMSAVHFVNPAALLLLFAIPLLALFFRYGDRRRAGALRAWGGATRVDARRRVVKRVLQLTSAAALVIALARPSLTLAPAP